MLRRADPKHSSSTERAYCHRHTQGSHRLTFGDALGDKLVEGEQLFQHVGLGLEAIGGQHCAIEAAVGILQGVLPGVSSVRHSARGPPLIECSYCPRGARPASATASIWVSRAESARTDAR